jgi:endo-beta-N-acetylglucosaminidase D
MLNFGQKGNKKSIFFTGLFITEAGEGQTICKRLLGNRTELDRIIESMTDLAVRYNFDGWLINIENEIQVFCLKILRK